MSDIAELEAELQAERSDNAAANRKAAGFAAQLAEARKDTDRLEWILSIIHVNRSELDRTIDVTRRADHAKIERKVAASDFLYASDFRSFFAALAAWEAAWEQEQRGTK